MNALFGSTTSTRIHARSTAEDRRSVAKQDSAFLLRLWIGEHISIVDRRHYLYAGHTVGGEHWWIRLRPVSVSADVSGTIVVSGPRFSMHSLDLPELREQVQFHSVLQLGLSVWVLLCSKYSHVWRALACRMFQSCPLQKLFQLLCLRHLCNSLLRSFLGGSQCIM